MLTCGFVFVFLSAFFRMYHIKFDSLSAKETSTLISGDEMRLSKKIEIIYFLFSGMWNSSRCLGMFLGPCLGGVFIDNYGYQATALVFIGVYCVMMAVDAGELWAATKCKSQGRTISVSNNIISYDQNTYYPETTVTEEQKPEKMCLLQTRGD